MNGRTPDGPSFDAGTSPGADTGADPGVRRRLEAGIAAATVLGLDTSRAEAVLRAGATPARAAAALEELVAAAGIRRPVRDLVTERLRRRATVAGVGLVAEHLDMEELERGAIAVTHARARHGAGPLAPLSRLRDRDRGRPAPLPADHFRSWRERGALTDVANEVGRAIDDALPGMPAVLRGRYAAAFEREELVRRFGVSLDAVLHREEPEANALPANDAWRLVGVAQWLNALVFVASVAWLVAGALGRVGIPAQRLPIVGPVPIPLLLIVATIAIALLLLVALRRNADRVGRRWARRLEVVARIGAREVVEAEAFRSVDRLELARLRLAELAGDVEAAAHAQPPGGSGGK